MTTTAKRLALFLVAAILLAAAAKTHRKYLLMRKFGELQMRDLDITSIREVDMKAACNFDYVEASEVNHTRYRPQSAYAVGMHYSWLTGKYERIVGVTDMDLASNCELIQKASDYYQSSTTYLESISGMDDGAATAWVYRKIDPAKNDFPKKAALDYMMWREVRLELRQGVLQVSTRKEVNQHLF
ncbi:hypothetical protein [Hymenobacter cellulosilyticus]|uniref:Uncharacterized protein n=1 Tax=Hymenobacter cellulosilyticus TaxID=2932248 RepID=A0A8T9Q2K2_9BACT|nr:hypothetical protein [Hymenobacter cellulosilyticus]UOQ71182.1 hypothetical protein MUN79_21370 [Hymenobacter cellulosilyticus]